MPQENIFYYTAIHILCVGVANHCTCFFCFFFQFAEEDDWNIVIDECSSLTAKWEQLSGFLGLRLSLINSIKDNHPGDNCACWNEALKQWITQNYTTRRFGEPSWGTLLKAVAKVDKLQFKNLAAMHRGRKPSHCKNLTHTPSQLALHNFILCSL